MKNNIKAIRESKKIPQSKVCEALKISRSALVNKEAGRRSFSVEELLKLEIILNVSINDMFKETKEDIRRNMNIADNSSR